MEDFVNFWLFREKEERLFIVFVVVVIKGLVLIILLGVFVGINIDLFLIFV